MSRSVRILWVYIMHKCASIQNAMSDLTNLKQIRSEQHVELGKSRIQRDFKDLSAMMSWLSVHNPIDETNNSLRSMSSGVTAVNGTGLIAMMQKMWVLLSKKKWIVFLMHNLLSLYLTSTHNARHTKDQEHERHKRGKHLQMSM